MDNEDYICPICGSKMTYEEGLYWCDECGINNHSTEYMNKTKQDKDVR